MKSAIAIVLLGCFAASACDDGAETTSASCRDYCDKLELCDSNTDLSGCYDLCGMQRVRSPNFLTVRAKCTNDKSCNIWQGEVGLMGEDICASGDKCELNACINDALYDQKTTATQAAYCSNVANKLNACDRQLAVTDLTMHCTDLVATLSDDYLDEMMGCIQSDCAQVVSCLKRAASRFDTDLTMYPGSLAQAVP